MKSNKLFIVWAVIVVVIIGLLTYLGFMLTSIDKDYKTIEEKLQNAAEGYVDVNALYPSDGDTLKVTSDTLVKEGVLDNLEYNGDKCTGYVEVSFDNVYKYTPFIKCSKYTTKGYK